MSSKQNKTSALRKQDPTLTPEAYRTPMMVARIMVFEFGDQRLGYYICPRCNNTMEREFTSFCDRCGQALDWKEYKKAVVVYPNRDFYNN